MEEETITEENVEETQENVEEGMGQEKPKKKKKVVRRRKSRKEKENPVTSALRLTVESGSVEFGTRRGLTADNVRMYVIAKNTPTETAEKITEKAKKSETPLMHFNGSTLALGSVCGKPFPVALLSIMDPGTSNILEMA
jgi:large subunit ribosomal protein L30e